MWVVAMVGVYLQNVRGPYASFEEARVAAQTLALADVDDYHDWAPTTLSLNGLADTQRCSFKGPPKLNQNGGDYREATEFNKNFDRRNK